jgi:hypothetical protein
MNKDETTNSTAPAANDTTTASQQTSAPAAPVTPGYRRKPADVRREMANKKNTKKVKPAAKPTVAKPAAKKKAEPKVSEPKVDNFNRDFGRYRFQGVDRPKGRTVLAIVEQYCKDKNPTSAELKETFKDSIGRSTFEVIVDSAAAKRMNSKGKKRYFTKDDQLIKLKDGKNIAVTNQIGSESMKTFVKFARTLGYNAAPSPKGE